MVHAGFWNEGHDGALAKRFACAYYTFWVWTIERQTSKELCCHAAALARVVVAARCARAFRLWFAQREKEIALAPYISEAAFVMD